MLNGELFRLFYLHGRDGERLGLKAVAEELFLLILAGILSSMVLWRKSSAVQ